MTFKNFFSSVTNTCNNNYIIVSNPDVIDYYPIHFLENIKLINVELGSTAAKFFKTNNQKKKSGICKNLFNNTCTGDNNIMIFDSDGTFFNQPGAIVSDPFVFVSKNKFKINCKKINNDP